MTKHTKGHNMHSNSIQAYAAMQAGEKPYSKRGKIWDLLCASPPLTDKQIAAKLGLTMAQIQPRISDMINDGELIEDGKAQDPISGLPVRVVRIRNSDDREVWPRSPAVEETRMLKEYKHKQETDELKRQLMQAHQRIRFLENKLARVEG